MEHVRKMIFQTTIYNGNDTQFFKNEAEGIVVTKDNQITYVTFEDKAEEDERVNSEVTFFLEEDGIIMMREGDVMMEQRFEVGKQLHGLYNTSEGNFRTMSDTKNIEIIGNHDNGKIHIEYDAYFSRERIGKITVTVEYDK